MGEIICEECGRVIYASVLPIDKQIAGEYKRLMVCYPCWQKHQLYLESLRENFKIQFGDR